MCINASVYGKVHKCSTYGCQQYCISRSWSCPLVVSHLAGSWNPNSDPLQVHYVLLTTEPALQPLKVSFNNYLVLVFRHMIVLFYLLKMQSLSQN